jgi:hypothetical protein
MTNENSSNTGSDRFTPDRKTSDPLRTGLLSVSTANLNVKEGTNFLSIPGNGFKNPCSITIPNEIFGS